MRIGFYGPSSVCWVNSNNNISFIDQIKLRYDAKIVNVGVPQGSQERILFELKKRPVIPKLDYAIIFYSSPKYIFLPKSNRDISISDVRTDKADYFFNEVNLVKSQEVFESNYFSYSNLKELFGSATELRDALVFYKKYFYDPDLMFNRYYSTVLMTDSYLHKLGCKSFHAIVPEYIPSWLKITSGIINKELALLDWTKEKAAINPKHPNNLTILQNNYITEILAQWIDSHRDS